MERLERIIKQLEAEERHGPSPLGSILKTLAEIQIEQQQRIEKLEQAIRPDLRHPPLG